MRTEFSECVALPFGVNNALMPMAGVSTSVFVVNPTTGADTGSAVQAYKDRISDIPGNTVTDESGNVSFYLEQGDYNIHFADTRSPARFAPYTRAFTSLSSGISADSASLATTLATLDSRSWIERRVQIFGTDTTTSPTYTLLGDAISVVQINKPTIIGIDYDAQWSESVAGAARAAIVIWGPEGAWQLQIDGQGSIQTEAASRGTAGVANNWGKLTTCPAGLISSQAATYSDDVISGPQARAIALPSNMSGNPLSYELGGTVMAGSIQPLISGGICWTMVDPGSYDVGTFEIDIQFKISSGTLSVKERTLRIIKAPF